MNTTLGTLICALGGIAGATFALPFRRIKTRSYETYWFVYALFGLVVFPLVLAGLTCPRLFDIVGGADSSVLVRCIGFGALWGLGGLTWGLMIRYLGIGLGLAIGCGLCSATGTLIPPIVTGHAGDLVADKAAVVTLVSVIVSLFGIVLVGLAGKLKEGELDEEAKKKAVAEFDFKKGMIVALFSGIASAGMNFGLQGGAPLEAAAAQAGVDAKWVGMPVLVVVLWGGFIVNAAWCFWQNAKNRTFGEYKASPANAVLLWAALAGVIWACQFACQKIGEPAMGDMRYISFAIVMGSCVLFSSLLGVLLGEWKGTGVRTRLALAGGLIVLAVSIVIAVLVKAGPASGDGVTVSVEGDAQVQLLDDVVSVTSTGEVSFVRISWPRALPRETRILNDAWERSYGELEWKGLETARLSPWYYLANDGDRTWGVGVETGPGAMCCWEVTTNATTLVLDLRAGGRPVRLGGRTLKACRIVRAESNPGETAWRFGRRFCKLMCPTPRLPKTPVYGYNDWYCAYGKNTATNFLADAAYIMECAKGCANPPYVVMDDGWQKNSPPVVKESGRGPWDAAGANFGMDMPTFCKRIAALGAKPGLWYRPLRAWDELPAEQKLLADDKYLDPTVPAVRARIVEDMARFRDWGFKLVKIDFLSYDLSQLWPCDAHPHMDRYIQDDRAWRDSSRTTAEVMLDLYRAMKDTAGDGVVIIGCNALNHLAAGTFELQRTGNDTSGKNWAWTKNHGVNTLAMRSIQDGAFFKLDADCVGLAEAGAVPWKLNGQWMDLLGRSGTPFFVSWRRQLAGPEVRQALSKAFSLASQDRDVIEPLDWMKTRTPTSWRDASASVSYDWE